MSSTTDPNPQNPQQSPEPAQDGPQSAQSGPPSPQRAQDPTGAQNAPQGAPEPDPMEAVDDVAALRREAANRRRALRATEQERDALRQQVDNLHRAEVEKRAQERFADVRDLWAVVSLDDLRGEDGQIDLDRVDQRFGQVLQDRPHWKKPPPVPDPSIFAPGPRPEAEPPQPSFGQQVKRTLRGG